MDAILMQPTTPGKSKLNGIFGDLRCLNLPPPFIICNNFEKTCNLLCLVSEIMGKLWIDLIFNGLSICLYSELN